MPERAKPDPDNPPRDGGEDLESLVGYNLKRAYMLFQDEFRTALGPDGLSTREFSALSLVIEQPFITQSDLARTLGIERSGLVAIVDKLEKSGFLQRRTVPGDRRVQALAPTDAGKTAYHDALAKVRDGEARLLAELDADAQRALVDLLKMLRHPGAG